jgi:hypothetical protein
MIVLASRGDGDVAEEQNSRRGKRKRKRRCRLALNQENQAHKT